MGDTTTTMMWIDGVSPLDVLEAYVAAFAALAIFGVPASLQQQRYSPILKEGGRHVRIDWARVWICAIILLAAIAANVVVNLRFPAYSDRFPFIGAAVWVALFACVPWRKPEWALLPEAFKGSVFLLSLILCASMMPVEKLARRDRWSVSSCCSRSWAGIRTSVTRAHRSLQGPCRLRYPSFADRLRPARRKFRVSASGVRPVRP